MGWIKKMLAESVTQMWSKDNFILSMDKTKLDVEIIYQFLTDSYWAKGRTLDEVIFSIKNSICFGLYDGNQQIGFARIVTDSVLFAYLCDVFILPHYQRRGLGKWLIDTIFNIQELKNIKTWMLATKDAHDLYEKFKFKLHQHPERLMVRKTIVEQS
jgi:GNAT superfamily N-acetyltransferase